MLPASTEQEAFALTERLRAVSSREFSAGVSAWDTGESASPVYDRADVALRRARSIGRNRTMLESSHLPPLAIQLGNALAAETIDVSYQPIVRLNEDHGGLIGVEALLRWTPAFGPHLEAGEVIRVAEDNDLIARLDQYVLRRACRDAQWMQRQSPDLRLSLSVNVSGLELVQEGYAARVIETLASTAWPTEQLILEVTETVLDVDRPSSISALHELRAHGIRIAVDDFGTGYSSLSRLQKMPHRSTQARPVIHRVDNVDIVIRAATVASSRRTRTRPRAAHCRRGRGDGAPGIRSANARVSRWHRATTSVGRRRARKWSAWLRAPRSDIIDGQCDAGDETGVVTVGGADSECPEGGPQLKGPPVQCCDFDRRCFPGAADR